MRLFKSLMRFLLLVPVLLLATRVTAAEILPVKLDQYGRMLVPVEIYGRMQVRHFLFDTSARYPLLLNRDNGAMGIKLIKKGTLNHVSTMGLIRLPVAHIEAYMLGNRMVENAVVGFFPDWAAADGLMGNDAFHGRIVHWVPEDRQLRIYPNLAPISDDRWQHLGGRAGKSFSLIVTTEYRGKELDVVIATGLSRSIIDTSIVGELSLSFGATGALDEDRIRETGMRGLNPDAEEGIPVSVPGFAIGDWWIGDFVPLASYVDRVEMTGFMNSRVILLGADVLSRQEVAFDFRDFHLWVKTVD